MKRLFVAGLLSVIGLGAASHASATQDAEELYDEGVLASNAEDYEAAVAAFSAACDLGLLDACASLEFRRRNGQGLPKDEARANRELEALCQNGSPNGCSGVGSAYYFGTGYAKDIDRAVPYYERACETDTRSGVACNNLGVIFRDGEGSTSEDPDRAREYFEKGCDLDNPTSCWNLGRGFRTGDFGPVDYDLSIQFLRKGCDLDDGRPCNDLGIALRATDNPARDVTASFNAYVRACDLEGYYGCTNAASSIQNPAFESSNAREKLTLYQRGCDLDSALGCYQAGWILSEGDIVAGDAAQAQTFFERACEMEASRWSAEGCYLLADRFTMGPHVAINELRDSQRASRRAGDWQDAIADSTKALAMLEELGHTENSQYALVLQQHGLNLNDGGLDVEGADFSRRSYETYARIYGDDHRSTLNGLHNYATLVAEQGNYELAEELMERVWVTRQRTLGVDHGDTLAAAKNYVIQLQRVGRYAEAEETTRTAYALASERYGPLSPMAMSQRYQLARIDLALGRLDDAVGTIDEMVAQLSRRQNVGVDPVVVYGFKAIMEAQLGRFETSLKLRELLFDFEVRQNGREHRDTISAATRVAYLLGTLERFDEAEEIHRENLRITRQIYGEDHTRTFGALGNVAAMLGQQGRFDEQLILDTTIFERRRAIFGDDHPTTLAAAWGVVISTSKVGEKEEAERLARAALENSEAVFSENVAYIISRRVLHASMLADLERFEEAEPIYRASLAQQIELLGADNPAVISTKINLADLLLDTDRPAEAEGHYRDALAFKARRLGAQHKQVIDLGSSLIAALLDQSGRSNEAYELARELVLTLDTRREADTSNWGQAGGVRREPVSSMDRYLLVADASWSRRAAEGATGDQELELGFVALQNAMDGPASRALAASAGRRLAEQKGEALGELVRRREALIESSRQIEQALVDAFLNEGQDGEAIRSRLEADKSNAAAELAEIDGRLEIEAPDYFSLVNSSTLSVAEAQALMGQDEAMVLIVPTERGTHVVAITSDAVTWTRSQWTLEQVNAATRRLLWDVGGNVDVSNAESGRWEREGEGAYPYDRSTAFALYSALFQPLESAIGDKRHLFIAGAGSLSSFPLAALVTEQPQGVDGNPDDLRSTAWLADKYAIIQLPSLQSLDFLRRFGTESEAGSTLTMRGFGDPILEGEAATRGGRGASRSAGLDTGNARSAFARTRGGENGLANVAALRNLARLPGTRRELEAIREALGASAQSIDLGEDATETRFKAAALGDVDIIVLATHGLLAGEIDGAFEPGLVFTPPASAGEIDDGFLSTSEVAALQLGADWVILSACNTAASDGSEGAPGLSGLAKAFFFAGARNLLASHWPVRDDVAALITVRAIEIKRDRPELSRAEALQQSMIEIRNDTRADGPRDTWAHPNAWAPFTLIGDGAR